MKQFWIWPIALYLFLGGLGGGMMAFAAIVGLIMFPSALTSGALVWGVFVAFLILGIGTGLLVFELGQPWLFYRAFVTRTSVIKWGAVFLSISMIFGVLFIFWEITWFQIFPFIPYEGLAQFFLAIAGFFGLCVTIYTGVLLSSMKSRPFWNTPVPRSLHGFRSFHRRCHAEHVRGCLAFPGRVALRLHGDARGCNSCCRDRALPACC